MSLTSYKAAYRNGSFPAVSSAAIPGAGQLYTGHITRGVVFVSLFLFVVLLNWIARLPETFYGLLASKVVCWTLPIAASIDAWLLSPAAARRKRVLLVVIPLAVLCGDIPISVVNLGEGFRAFVVTNTAMEPTLHIRERFMAERASQLHPVKRGDVLAFRHNGVLTVKRAIGLAGDTVTGRDQKIFVNGEELSEPYVQHIDENLTTAVGAFGPVRVPSGQFFVLGDNRDVSYDSRFRNFSFVAEIELIGRVLYLYYSPEHSRIGLTIR